MIRIRSRAFKACMVATGAMWLGACEPGAPVTPSRPDKPDSAETGYVAPPVVEAARRDGDRVILSGQGAPAADVRLGSPTGEAVMSQTDLKGRWSLSVRAAPGVRLFGLSTTKDGRTVQAEGYVMVAEDGEAALLRAGAGALRLAPASSAPRILTVDVDREGGAVVSGVAAPGAGLNVRVDRVTRGGGRTDEAGRFSISLNAAMTPGAHDIQVAGEGGEDAASVMVSPPQPLTAGPVRAERAGSGWRVDWMTPGGGTQTTLLIGARS